MPASVAPGTRRSGRPGAAPTPPATAGDRPEPPKQLPDPPASPVCLVEGKAPPSVRLDLLARVDDQYSASLPPGGQGRLSWLMRNQGNVSLDQLLNPKLSVAIFAQNGVYAYFAAAFVPVLFGTFLHDTPLVAVASAAVTAVAVHFALYYTGQHYFPYYVGVTVKNPGISTALGVA